jgi:hypothetical protein
MAFENGLFRTLFHLLCYEQPVSLPGGVAARPSTAVRYELHGVPGIPLLLLSQSALQSFLRNSADSLGSSQHGSFRVRYAVILVQHVVTMYGSLRNRSAHGYAESSNHYQAVKRSLSFLPTIGHNHGSRQGVVSSSPFLARLLESPSDRTFSSSSPFCLCSCHVIMG